MKIFLIRHGESTQNTRESFINKIPDHYVSLTNKGIEEANRAGVFLKEYCLENNINLDNSILWVSPFIRTRETANIINNYMEIPKQKEDITLVEQSYGLCCIYDKEIIKELYPYEFELRDICYKNEGKFYAKYPTGESPFDVAIRTRHFVEMLYRNNEDTIFVVSHGVAIRTLVMNLMHYTPEWYNREINPENCSIRLIDTDIPTEEYIYNKPKIKTKTL